MSDFMFWTLLVFAILSWIGVLTVGVPWFVGREFKRNGYEPAPEPEIDLVTLEIELQAEFGR